MVEGVGRVMIRRKDRKKIIIDDVLYVPEVIDKPRAVAREGILYGYGG